MATRWHILEIGGTRAAVSAGAAVSLRGDQDAGQSSRAAAAGTRHRRRLPHAGHGRAQGSGPSSRIPLRCGVAVDPVH